MSFGWSAGDIAKVIELIVKIVQALDNANGAPADYREAVVFLVRIKHTLEPLQSFTVLEAYPAYKDEIRQCVENIKSPIESCLTLAARFKTSLGEQSHRGRHRNFGKKLDWRFSASKKVNRLRKSIEGQLTVLETLLNRLTLYFPCLPSSHSVSS